jgi:hypothetical protein
MLFVQSVCITQLELLDAVQAVTGKHLETELVDSFCGSSSPDGRTETMTARKWQWPCSGSSGRTERGKRPSRTSCSAWRRRIWKRS